VENLVDGQHIFSFLSEIFAGYYKKLYH